MKGKIFLIFYQYVPKDWVIYLHIYFNIHVCLSVLPASAESAASRTTSDFYHVQRSRGPVRPLLSEAKPSYICSILTPHGKSFNSIPLPLHVVLELNKYSLALPCSVPVWLGYWNSKHDEIRKWAMAQRDGPPPLYGWKDINFKIIM